MRLACNKALDKSAPCWARWWPAVCSNGWGPASTQPRCFGWPSCPWWWPRCRAPPACRIGRPAPCARERARQLAAAQPGFARFGTCRGVRTGLFQPGVHPAQGPRYGLWHHRCRLLYVLFNTTCVVAAPPVDRLGDRVGRSRIVVLGYALYAGINLWLVFAGSVGDGGHFLHLWRVLCGRRRAEQGLHRRPGARAPRYGSGGPLQLCHGVLYLPASLVAGSLRAWSPPLAFGPSATVLSVLGHRSLCGLTARPLT